MQEIKKIEKKSLAKIIAVFYGLSGVAVFLSIIISSILNIIVSGNFSGSLFKLVLFNIGLGLVLGIVVGLITAVIGLAVGYVSASIYNLLTVNFGGLKIELEETKEEKQAE